MLAKLKRYRAAAAWLLRDAFWRFRAQFIAIIALSAASLVAQFLALFLLYTYARALEKNRLIEIQGYQFEPRDSALLLIAVALSTLLCFGIGVGFSYLARVRTLELGRLYEELCSKRAIALAGSLRHREMEHGWESQLWRSIQSDPRTCGRVARSLINAVLPVLFVIATSAALIYLDPLATLALLVLVVIAAPFLYRASVRAARYSSQMERTALAASKAKQQLLSSQACRPDILEPDHAVLDQPFRSGALKQNLDAYVGRMRAVEDSSLVAGLLMGAALVFILAQQGEKILTTGQGWSDLAVYLIVLRVQLSNVSQTMRTLTTVNRFYPQVMRHMQFLEELQGIADGSIPPKKSSGRRSAASAASNWDELDEAGGLE